MMDTGFYYFGALDDSGHYAYLEGGRRVDPNVWIKVCPWGFEADGGIQPKGHQREGEAIIVRKNGWTALTFWDRTMDHRPGSHSTYIADGNFTFAEMVELAKARFPARWQAMKFEVRLVEGDK